MAMEHGPGFEDVFPIEHGDFPASHVSLLEGRFRWNHAEVFIQILSLELRHGSHMEQRHSGKASRPQFVGFLRGGCSRGGVTREP